MEMLSALSTFGGESSYSSPSSLSAATAPVVARDEGDPNEEGSGMGLAEHRLNSSVMDMVRSIAGEGDPQLRKKLEEMGHGVDMKDHWKRLYFLHVADIRGPKLRAAMEKLLPPADGMSTPPRDISGVDVARLIGEIDAEIETWGDDLRREDARTEGLLHNGHVPSRAVLKRVRAHIEADMGRDEPIGQGGPEDADKAEASRRSAERLNKRSELLYMKSILLDYTGKKLLERVDSKNETWGCSGNVVVFLSRLDVEFRRAYVHEQQGSVRRLYAEHRAGATRAGGVVKKAEGEHVPSLHELREEMIGVVESRDPVLHKSISDMVLLMTDYLSLSRRVLNWTTFVNKLAALDDMRGPSIADFFNGACGGDVRSFVSKCERRYHKKEKDGIYDEFARGVADAAMRGSMTKADALRMHVELRNNVFRYHRTGPEWDNHSSLLVLSFTSLIVDQKGGPTRLALLHKACQSYHKFMNKERFPHMLCRRFAGGVLTRFYKDPSLTQTVGDAYYAMCREYHRWSAVEREAATGAGDSPVTTQRCLEWDIVRACVLYLLVATPDAIHAFQAFLMQTSYVAEKVDV